MIPAGRVSDEPWAFWDFLPTAAEIAGVQLPQGMKTDGLSLVKMLKGGPAPEREYFYWELHEGPFIQAVRMGQWKAVRNGPKKPLELYNLASDEAEKTDVASKNPEIVAKAEKLLQTARTEDSAWPITENAKERAQLRKKMGISSRAESAE